jgi:hypothetical protein
MDKVSSKPDTPARGKPGQLPLTPRTQTGPIAYAYWANAPCAWPISSFTTTREVPPVPETNNGQTLFLYNHIEPNLKVEVLQAVLQVRVSEFTCPRVTLIQLQPVWRIGSRGWFILVGVNLGECRVLRSRA